MGWGANQWLRVCKEATYGVALPALDAGSAVEGTDYWWVRLDANNSFTPRRDPQFWTVRSADGGNRAVQSGSSFYTVKGAVNTLLYPTRASLWMAAALTLTSNDLSSYTFDFFDTVTIRRFLGFKIGDLTITCDSGGQIAKLQINVEGKAQDLAAPATFAAPAITNFPSEDPYTHVNSAGLVKLNNVVQTKYSSVKVMIKNHLAPCKDELATISNLYYAGRDVSWELKMQMTAATNRTLLEAAAAAITNQVKWSNGTNALTLDLKSTNFVRKVADELPLAGAAYQTVSADSLLDRTAATDVAFTAT
jgi:hypothetical protein